MPLVDTASCTTRDKNLSSDTAEDLAWTSRLPEQFMDSWTPPQLRHLGFVNRGDDYRDPRMPCCRL